MKITKIEELNELKAWFDSQELPETLNIDKATYTPDLKKTINMLFEQAYIYHQNVKMQGSIVLLKRIKTTLEEKKMKCIEQELVKFQIKVL